MTAYYNELDKYAAQWLRNLIAAGHIAPGDVDDRSISDVRPSDLVGYTQCHFFAGIGGWSLALRLAGWPDDRPVWTGSCPCQPFSVAGQGAGTADERHLWPHWFHLVRSRRPPVIFGEQVDAAIAHGWLDAVQDDLEGEGYAFGAVGVPAAGVGAPHIRQRLWFVADSRHQQSKGWDGPAEGHQHRKRDARGVFAPRSSPVHMADSQHDGGRSDQQKREAQGGVADGWPSWLDNNNNTGLEGLGFRHQAESRRVGEVRPVATAGESGELGLADSTGSQSRDQATSTHGHRDSVESASFWTPCDWLPCRDGKWRPVEPGTFPLAHGVSNRVGRLRAYGNAIVPQVAAEVIRAYMECRPC